MSNSIESFVQVIKTGSEFELKKTLFKRMQSDVLHLIEAGVLPPNVSSFPQIDDHVDGNDLGDLCADEVFDALIDRYGGRDSEEGLPTGMTDMIDSVQSKLSIWLQ